MRVTIKLPSDPSAWNQYLCVWVSVIKDVRLLTEPVCQNVHYSTTKSRKNMHVHKWLPSRPLSHKPLRVSGTLLMTHSSLPFISPTAAPDSCGKGSSAHSLTPTQPAVHLLYQWMWALGSERLTLAFPLYALSQHPPSICAECRLTQIEEASGREG